MRSPLTATRSSPSSLQLVKSPHVAGRPGAAKNTYGKIKKKKEFEVGFTEESTLRTVLRWLSESEGPRNFIFGNMSES